LAPEIEAPRLDRFGRGLERYMKRDGLADFQRRDVPGGKRHAHAIGTVLRLEIVEGKDAQGDPCASLFAQFMRLDEACQVRVAEFMRQHGRADHFRAELGCGETSGKGKRGPAEA